MPCEGDQITAALSRKDDVAVPGATKSGLQQKRAVPSVADIAG
jgi:hypothetical protein